MNLQLCQKRYDADYATCGAFAKLQQVWWAEFDAEVIPNVMIRWGAFQNHDTQVLAIEAIGELKLDERKLLQLMGRESGPVRVEAVRALARIPKSGSLSKRFLQKCLSDDYPSVRMHAADAYISIFEGDYEGAVAQALANEKDDFVYVGLVNALVRGGELQHAKAYLPILDKYDSVRATPLRLFLNCIYRCPALPKEVLEAIYDRLSQIHDGLSARSEMAKIFEDIAKVKAMLKVAK